MGAVKTGALWESCDDLLMLPKGSRAAIRRDLLGWARDCIETMHEFQEILDVESNVIKEEDEEGDVSQGIEKLSLDKQEESGDVHSK